MRPFSLSVPFVGLLPLLIASTPPPAESQETIEGKPARVLILFDAEGESGAEAKKTLVEFAGKVNELHPEYTVRVLSPLLDADKPSWLLADGKNLQTIQSFNVARMNPELASYAPRLGAIFGSKPALTLLVSGIKPWYGERSDRRVVLHRSARARASRLERARTRLEELVDHVNANHDQASAYGFMELVGDFGRLHLFTAYSDLHAWEVTDEKLRVAERYQTLGREMFAGVLEETVQSTWYLEERP